jgi:hypothetical protein
LLRSRNAASQPPPCCIAQGFRNKTFQQSDGNPVKHRVSAKAQAKLLDYAADALAESAFGLHLAEQSDPRDAGIFSMSHRGPKTSATRWRSSLATSVSSTKPSASN